MKKIILTISAVGMLTIMFSGCAESNYNAGYNSYDNRDSQQRKLDNVAYDSVSNLSAKETAALNNLK